MCKEFYEAIKKTFDANKLTNGQTHRQNIPQFKTLKPAHFRSCTLLSFIVYVAVY